MSNKSAAKIHLRSYDDLFGVGKPTGSDSDQVVEVLLTDLLPFKNHPFRVTDDEKMAELAESVRKYGVLTPGIVRPCPGRGYELIAGHRRKRASELAGNTTMPVFIRNCTDDEAVVFMVDSNFQRENILPSEKARAYAMKYEALKHQGAKKEKDTAQEVGESTGDSARTVQRYIRLACLTEKLLAYVDQGKILLVAGEKLSYLTQEEQGWVAEAVADGSAFPTAVQAAQMKNLKNDGTLTEKKVREILAGKKHSRLSLTLPERRIRDYFPDGYTKEQMEEVIYSLLTKWKNGEKEEA